MSNVIDMEAWLGRAQAPVDTPESAASGDGSDEYVIDEGTAVYKVREVARLLALSLGSTYELVRTGEIPATRLGNRWIIPKSRFHAWLDSCAEEPRGGAV